MKYSYLEKAKELKNVNHFQVTYSFNLKYDFAKAFLNDLIIEKILGFTLAPRY
jgi:hypothetical protein